MNYINYTVKEIKDKLKEKLKKLEEYKDTDIIEASNNLAELQEYGDVLLIWNTKVGETYIDLDYPNIRRSK